MPRMARSDALVPVSLTDADIGVNLVRHAGQPIHMERGGL